MSIPSVGVAAEEKKCIRLFQLLPPLLQQERGFYMWEATTDGWFFFVSLIEEWGIIKEKAKPTAHAWAIK